MQDQKLTYHIPITLPVQDGAPGLVWKCTKKAPCQQELDPIDLVCTRL